MPIGKQRKALGEFVWVLDGKTSHPARLAFPYDNNNNNNENGGGTCNNDDSNDSNKPSSMMMIEIQWTTTGKFQTVPLVNVSFPDQQQQQQGGDEKDDDKGKQQQMPRRRSTRTRTTKIKQEEDSNPSSSTNKRKSTNRPRQTISSAVKSAMSDDEHEQQDYINQRVAKYFYTTTETNNNNHRSQNKKIKEKIKLYFGTVTKCHTIYNGRKLWHILYEEDNDSEAVCYDDLQSAIKLYHQHQQEEEEQTKTPATTTSTTAASSSSTTTSTFETSTTATTEGAVAELFTSPPPATAAAAATSGGDATGGGGGSGGGGNEQQEKIDTIISKLSFNSINNNNKYLYRRVAKLFYGKVDFGNIVGMTEFRYYVVSYDDGDREDWDEDEVQLGLQLCQQQVQQHNTNYNLWEIFNLYEPDDCTAWANDSMSIATTAAAVAPTSKKRKVSFPKDFRTNPELVSKFFLMMLERQRCWIRRRGLKLIGSDGNANRDDDNHCYWTNSRLLQEYYFCNNYRELDRGTAFFHNHVVRNLWKDHTAKMNMKIGGDDSSNDDEDDHDDKKNEWKEWFESVLWASYCYRLVNKVESFSNVGKLPTSEFGRIPTRSEWKSIFKGIVLKMQDARNNEEELPGFFTGAHQTCNHHNYVEWMDEIADPKSQEWGRVVEVAKNNGSSLEAIYQAISINFHGCGPFMSWQICCDLLESNTLPKIKSIDFCVLGKGAKAGIGEIFFGTDRPPKGVKKEEYLRLTQLLVDYQEVILRQLKSTDNIELVFPKWRNKSIGLKEMEHALCEFSKWQRIERGIYGDSKKGGQRLRKSRSFLDEKLKCQSCFEDLYKTTTSSWHNILTCCTCMQGYCKECLPNPVNEANNDDPIYWRCQPCLDFERYEWKNLD